MEFPGEVRKPRGQHVGCALHVHAEVAKKDDMLGVERDFEIGTNFSMNCGKFPVSG